MKTIAKQILLAFMLLIPMATLAAENEVTIILDQAAEEDDEPDYNEGRGLRSAPAPIICVIDFAQRSVNVGIADEITSYEIWSDDQSVCLSASDDDASFVEALAELQGEYCVRFVSESRAFRGWIAL